jgi:hypothetical protein
MRVCATERGLKAFALFDQGHSVVAVARAMTGSLVAAPAATVQRAMERIADDRQDPEYRSVVG